MEGPAGGSVGSQVDESTEGEGARGAPRRGGCSKAGARRGAPGEEPYAGRGGAEATARAAGGGDTGRGRGAAGTTPRWFWREQGKSGRGGSAGDRAGVSSRAAHPADGAASPLSPGPAASPGRLASQLSGPRAASRRLRHLRANAPGGRAQPPLPRGRRRAAPVGSARSPPPAGLAAARLNAGQPDGPLRRPAEFRPPGRRARAPPAERHPSSLPLGTVGGAPASAHREGAGRGRLHSALRRGSRAGPREAGGGVRPLSLRRGSQAGPLRRGRGGFSAQAGPGAGRGLSPPPKGPNPPSPRNSPGQRVNWMEVDEFMKFYSKTGPKGVETL